jgi:hypothetical protein
MGAVPWQVNISELFAVLGCFKTQSKLKKSMLVLHLLMSPNHLGTYTSSFPAPDFFDD